MLLALAFLGAVRLKCYVWLIFFFEAVIVHFSCYQAYDLNYFITNASVISFCREEIERQKAHERYMRLQEQGKTEQARKDLGNNHASTLLFTLSLSYSV